LIWERVERHRNYCSAVYKATTPRVRGEMRFVSAVVAAAAEAVVIVVIVGFFGEGGGDGDGDRDGGVGGGAGAGAGTIGSGSGCTGSCIEVGSGGSIFEESAATTALRFSQTAASVVRKQLFTALLAAPPASLLPILETSQVSLALLLVVLPGQKTRPYSALNGILTISSLK
jgi:hypothetical protein